MLGLTNMCPLRWLWAPQRRRCVGWCRPPGRLGHVARMTTQRSAGRHKGQKGFAMTVPAVAVRLLGVFCLGFRAQPGRRRLAAATSRCDDVVPVKTSCHAT